jgi:serine protease Do
MKPHALLRSCWLALTAGGFLLSCPLPAHAQKADFRKSSPQVVQVFRPVVARPSESTVRVRCDDRDVALGTVTGADGWILTKASALSGKIICRLKNGQELPAKVIGVQDKYDLAMLRVEPMGTLTPVKWEDSKAATVGRWAASVGTGEDPVAVGVISVAARPYKAGDQHLLNANGGFLGVGLDEADGGARIKSVMPGGPAQKAGLKADDVVIQVNKKKVLGMESFQDVVGRHKPGAEITLKVKRNKEVLELKAKLVRRPPQLAGNPQELMGSPLSNRRGGFPMILQHDGVLLPRDCGGPLVDLDGKVLGINIARAGRTETYAIPADAVRGLLADLMGGNLRPATKDD